jgi:hypothetical protein
MHPLPLRTFIVFGSILSVTASFAQTNLSGRWDVMMDPDFKGNPSIEHCRMKQQNRKLTMTCGAAGAAIVGEVVGQKISWKFTLPGGAIAAWSGELDKTAAKIKGVWLFTFEDGHKMRGDFTAQKRPN